mgnify:FL=1
MKYKDYQWCGRCYCERNDRPYGFCESCWIKHGRPEHMKASIRESKSNEN